MFLITFADKQTRLKMSPIDFTSHKLLEIFVQGLIKYDILIQQYIHKIYRPELNDEKVSKT